MARSALALVLRPSSGPLLVGMTETLLLVSVVVSLLILVLVFATVSGGLATRGSRHRDRLPLRVHAKHLGKLKSTANNHLAASNYLKGSVGCLLRDTAFISPHLRGMLACIRNFTGSSTHRALLRQATTVTSVSNVVRVCMDPS